MSVMTISRFALPCFLALASATFAAAPARADHRSRLIVDPASGVPIELREGDWGLYRPGAPPRRVYRFTPPPVPAPAPAYFPMTGRAPIVGRRERDPVRRGAKPRPAESFQRTWSAASDPVPAESGSRTDLPGLTIAPQIGPQLGPQTAPQPGPQVAPQLGPQIGPQRPGIPLGGYRRWGP